MDTQSLVSFVFYLELLSRQKDEDNSVKSNVKEAAQVFASNSASLENASSNNTKPAQQHKYLTKTDREAAKVAFDVTHDSDSTDTDNYIENLKN